MPYWQVHFLNARHALTGIMPEVRGAITESVAVAAGHLDLPDFDVVVQAGDGGSDWGVLGAAPAPGVVQLTLSPARFAPGLLIRRMVRELHHLARWERPGYGRSLGEVLVSEGLAAHFARGVLGGRPDPWDAATPPSGLAKRAMTEWAWREFDRGLWFEGKGNIRKWAGYGLAHRLVAEHLAREPDLDAAALVHVPAEALRPAMRRLSGGDEAEPEPVPLDPAQEAPPAEVPPLPGPAPSGPPVEDAEATETSQQGPASDASAGDGGEPPPPA